MARKVGLKEGSATFEDESKHQESEEYCLKVYEPFKDTMERCSAQNECKIANSMIGHPNIIKISEFQEDNIIIDGVKDKRCFAILEYCRNGDLFDYMTSYLETKADEDSIGMMAHDKPLLRSLMEQIISGMSALHKAGYAHLDIKLENILIGDDGILKLCDFGFSNYISKPVT